MRAIDDILNGEPAKTLYHYTNATGLLGILKTGHIWASSTYHLNDSGEYRYALSLIAKRVKERLKTETGSQKKRYDEILFVLEYEPVPIQAYVASFSEEGDLLSQWLAYPRATTGYALGLAPRQFAEARKRGFQLVSCVYDSEEQNGLADTILDAWLQLLDTDTIGPAYDRAVIEKLLTLAAAIKHPGFKQEAEWRLIKTLPVGDGWSKDVAFREGRNGIVPFLTAPLVNDDGALRPHSIHIGPNDDMQAALVSLQTLLDNKDLFASSKSIFGVPEPLIQIVCSKTPYRP